MDALPGATPTDRRRSRIAEAGLWCLVLAGMLSVNMDWSQDGNYFLALVGGTVAAAAVNQVAPPAAFAVAVALAAWDDRCYAVVALIAFLAGRHPRRRPGTAVWVACAVAPAVGAALLKADPPRALALIPVELLGLAVLPWLVGRYTYQRVVLDESGWAHADRLERERQMVAEQTRLRERARIAQDMHDSLGHDLGLLAVRAAVLEMTPGLDEEVRARAAELRAGAGAATERLHEIIGVLREDDTGPAPVTPGTETPEDLAERCRASGMDVTLEHTGESGDLSPMTAHALHRVMRESLTNAAKHAPGAAVHLRVEHGDGVTLVRVASEPPRDAPAASPGSGSGLTGLRERVRLLGGTFDAQPDGAGGFLVTARLPHRPAPSAPQDRPPTPERLHQDRRTLRRGFVKTAGLTVGALALAASVFTFVSGVPTLSDDEYASFALGAPRSALAQDLPSGQYGERPDREPAAPAGTVCEYYAADENFSPSHVYRLCFRDGRLASKDRIPLHDRDEADAG
ncbi:sensor histidine kinase [Streptomyces avicenniae]|uniref:sensor histidine kinase n=1 Tax=Streptomyces avicenniae TaxID=500153 RepID=UPI00069C3D08|nr:histidine kinase [Streptomyces avicenniae]